MLTEDFINKRNEMTRCALENGSPQRFIELYRSSHELSHAEPWLYEASAGGNSELVRFLLSENHSPDERNSTRRKTPALSAACRGGHHEVAQTLLKAGACVNATSLTDNPLFSAIFARSINCVKLLVDAGIDIHMTYDLGHRLKNALAFAVEEGCSDIAAYLRERGAVLPPSQ